MAFSYKWRCRPGFCYFVVEKLFSEFFRNFRHSPTRSAPSRTPHLHMSANALAARLSAPAVGRRAVLPSFRRAARAAAPRAPAARGRRALSVNADERLNVVFVGAECAPFSKTGGLGDVMASLPKVRPRSLPSRIASTRSRPRGRARESVSPPPTPTDKSANSAGVPPSQHPRRACFFSVFPQPSLAPRLARLTNS